MIRVTLFSLQLLLLQCAYAQHFVSQKWDARFGGIAHDEISAICQARDGGYIAVGTSYSGISGNKTQSNWGNVPNYWIVKTDVNGNYVWDHRYGGTGGEKMSCIITTSDGGYMLGGMTASDSSGDVSQASRGGQDYWVVKLDSLGHKQWDKRFGGSSDDYMYCMSMTNDGGYILGGRSNSGISGDKTQDNHDATLFTADYWIVKIDSLGNKQWDKRFGTLRDEACVSIIQTPNGGYLLGGTCPDSGISFDKTQVSFANGDNYWVIKIDSVGNKQWDKVYGGVLGEVFSNSLNTTDGHYMLSGTSFDGASGDKATSLCGYWLIKIDTLGNRLNDWVYGSGLGTGSGMCAEHLGSMSCTPDSGYLLTGTSGAVWTIKIDSHMNRVWDRIAATTASNDRSAGALVSIDGCYVIGVSTEAGMGGDKTQPNWDTTDQTLDYWIVKYCDSIPNGILEPEGAMHLLVYPNPTSSDLYINIQKDNLTEASFTLTSTTGQAIYQGTSDHLAHSYTKIIDLIGLPTGVYMLTVTVDGERIVKKVLKD